MSRQIPQATSRHMRRGSCQCTQRPGPYGALAAALAAGVLCAGCSPRGLTTSAPTQPPAQSKLRALVMSGFRDSGPGLCLFVSADTENGTDRLARLASAIEPNFVAVAASSSADGLSLDIWEAVEPNARVLRVSEASAPVVDPNPVQGWVDRQGREIARPDAPGGGLAPRWRFASGTVIDTTVITCDSRGEFVVCTDYDPNDYQKPNVITIRSVADPNNVLATRSPPGRASGLFVTDTHLYLAVEGLHSLPRAPAKWVVYARHGDSLTYERETELVAPGWMWNWVNVRDYDPGPERLLLYVSSDVPFMSSYYLYELGSGRMKAVQAAVSAYYVGFLDRRVFDSVK